MSIVNLESTNGIYPMESDEFYAQLTTRNRHFVSEETQKKLRKIKIFVAGCGSTGGACIESLARLGVENFALADNGTYELNNLNRQHAFLSEIGKNKSEFHARCLRSINPFIQIILNPEGVTQENVDGLTSWADVVIDAVDVTSYAGMQMKLVLHESSYKNCKPVFTALDIGFCQWGRSYDYRNKKTKLYGGKLDAARSAKHPMKALFTLVPISAVPAHALQLVHELLTKEDVSASQLGATSDLLSSIIVSSMIRFVETGNIIKGWNINLQYIAVPWSKRIKEKVNTRKLRREIVKLLKETE